MRIEFTVKTNMKKNATPMINTLHIRQNDNEDDDIVIDRNTTEWTHPDENGIMSMLWRECYLWDGEDELDIPEDVADKIKLPNIAFEVEDDAEEDEFYEILEVYVD